MKIRFERLFIGLGIIVAGIDFANKGYFRYQPVLPVSGYVFILCGVCIVLLSIKKK